MTPIGGHIFTGRISPLFYRPRRWSHVVEFVTYDHLQGRKSRQRIYSINMRPILGRYNQQHLIILHIRKNLIIGQYLIPISQNIEKNPNSIPYAPALR